MSWLGLTLLYQSPPNCPQGIAVNVRRLARADLKGDALAWDNMPPTGKLSVGMMVVVA